MSRNTLKAGFTTLDGTYLRRRGTEYRMIHDMIHKLAFVSCGQKLTECFIKYAPSINIRDHFIFESVTDELVNDDVILLSEDKEEEYFERLLSDLKESIVLSTFHNKQLIYQLFRDKFIRYFGRSDEAKQILKDGDPKGFTKSRDQDFLNLYNILTYPLIASVSYGYYDIVKFLIDTVKCDINIKDQRGMSLLYMASEGRQLDILTLLLQKTTDLFNCEISEMCPLYAACAKGYTDIVNLFLKHNIYQNDVARSSLNECVKGHAHIEPCYSCLDSCLQLNMSPCVYDKSLRCIVSRHKIHQGRDSPLHAACKGGHIDIVKLLLQTNADVNVCSRSGETPLYVACKGGHIDIVKILLQTNADVNVCSRSGETPLHAACKGGHADIVELLLQNKASVSQLDSSNNSSLHAAYCGGHTDIKDMLLQNIDNDNSFDEIEIFRALMVECQIGNIKSMELLLKKQIRLTVNFCDILEKKLFLHVACSRGHTGIVKLLLKKKANISQCNSEGESPLYMACANGHTDVVDILLQNNADVSQCKHNGETPFQAASANGHTDIVNILLLNEAGAS